MPEILQNIIAENRLENIRIVSENDDVIGGQPKPNGNDENDNNAIFDLACSIGYSIEKAKNAQFTADGADGKATAAQTKANQIPNPIKDRFVVGNTSTAYALLTVAEVKKLLAINDDIPVGSSFAWDFEEAPKNYLLRRGQTFSATEYPELAKLFPYLRLPDDRGVVLRGLDAGRGLDSGRLLGSYQEDATQRITGSVSQLQYVISQAANGVLSAYVNPNVGGTYPVGAPSSGSHSTGGINIDNSTQARTANENRMKNNAVNFIIKAK